MQVAEYKDVLTFSVTSDSTAGNDWVKRLEVRNFFIGSNAKLVLSSPDFQPTSGVTTKITVLKGTMFPNDYARTTAKVRAAGDRLYLTVPHPEVSCLIREQFSDEEIKAMGLCRIVVMHRPITVKGKPFFLAPYRFSGGRCLFSFDGYPDDEWPEGCGFAFAELPAN